MTMYWEDPADSPSCKVSEEIVDLGFRIKCRCLPADYAFALETTLTAVLPWLPDEPSAGIYLAYGAEFGNGWVRQTGDDALIYLSRHARLNLRLPQARIHQAMQLQGQTLNLAGYQCTTGPGRLKLLSTHGTLYARHLTPAAGDEGIFLENAAGMLRELDIKPLKMMAGRSRSIDTPQQKIETRSLMIDGLRPEESVRVQQRGLGKERRLGCGIFLPHKGIAAISSDTRM